MLTDRATFDDLVREALAHLYDRPFLRGHPLTSILVPARGTGAADTLRRLLLDAVDSLRPPESCPPASPTWRPYRYLVLRYVDGAKPEQIARELQVSVRQSRREHDRAIEAVADYLRDLLPDSAPTADLPPFEVRPADLRRTIEVSGAEADGAAALDGELRRIAATPPDEPADLAAALDEALRIVGRLVEQRAARIGISVAPHLPAVLAQRLVLRQTLIDLLGCAVDGTPAAIVHVAATTAGGRVRLEVASSASPPQGLSALVDRLGTTRRLVELQGGTLEASIGAGMTLAVSFPVARPRTVLVVDDNPDIAYLFDRFVRDRGYRVIQASTGPAALDLARAEQPAAITLDVLMPSQDGWDILRDLTGDPLTRAIPVILCSVLPERSLALSLGVAEFLNKPVTREALLGALQRCVPELAG